MKIFKHSKSIKDAKIASAVKSFSLHFRLKDKLVKANKWAEANKKSVSVATISILMLSLVLGSWLTIGSRNSEQGMLTGMADVKPMFDGMHRIQRVKDLQYEQTLELTNKGKRLKHELDSLVSLPIKTNKDSTDIVVKYKQLELVVKYLDNK